MSSTAGQFDIRLDRDRRVVRVHAHGPFTADDGKRMITAARSVAAEHEFNLLYDVRQVVHDIPVEEWFHLPRELPVLNRPDARRVRVALLMLAGATDDGFDFYELVSTNVGLAVRVMCDENEALDWLTADD